MARLIGIDHVQLAMPVGGEDEARGFYRDVLGLSEVPKPSALDPRGCWFEGGKLRVHLGVQEDFRPAAKAHPAFVVVGLDELVSAARERDLRVLPAADLDGQRRAHVFDPFGNRIELVERVARD